MAMKTLTSVVGFVAALLAAHLAGAQVTTSIDTFNDNVAAYLALHHQVERYLPPQRNFVDAEEVLAYSAALRRGLCALRPTAKEGDVFGPAADEFRRRIRYALRAHGLEVRDLLLEMREDTEEGARPPVVNEAFSWALGNLMPIAVIDSLPALPDELQYRLVGGRLVLVDIHAGLVVDVLRSALAVETIAQ
jgi:hypothetical protein